MLHFLAKTKDSRILIWEGEKKEKQSEACSWFGSQVGKKIEKSYTIAFFKRRWAQEFGKKFLIALERLK